MEYVADVEAYADRLRPDLQQAEDRLLGSVKSALRRHGERGWSDALVARAVRLLAAQYREQSGRTAGPGLRAETTRFKKQVVDSLAKVTPESDARTIAGSIAAAVISAGTLAAALDRGDEGVFKVWVDMHDDRVRTAHREASGQKVPLGEKFEVGGVRMDRPGDMSAPIELWINCRCIVTTAAKESEVAASLGTSAPEEGMDMTDLLEDFADATVVDLTGTDDDGVDDTSVPWYGVLAPEGVMSGDNRKFSPDSLTWRDLPLPLAWQKVNSAGHDGSVVVGRIDEIWREEGVVKARGMMLSTPEADEAIGLLSEQGIRGVSVDVDSATMQMEDNEGNTLDGDTFSDDAVMNVTAGRICGATLCAIPAFMEAHVLLGMMEEEPEALVASAQECLPCQYKAGVDEGTWDGSAGNYTDQEWFDATIVHLGTGDERLVKSNNKLPIYTPGGKLSRAGVHAAVGRLNQTDAPPAKINAAKATLRGAYEVLGEDVPDALKAAIAEALEFGEFGEFVKTEDGPGWLTHPVDTERLRKYWTKGKGALKIRWGTSGDFNRCRLQLAKYIKPQYLNGYCANRHYDALGFWPGRPVAAETKDFSGPSLHLVASGWDTKPPLEWFEDPHLTGPSPIVVTEDGRVFGHLAAWGQCHIGFGQDNCTIAPASPTNYAYYRVGAVLTDGGEVPVGHITMGTGHADGRLTAAAAAAHYDNTGSVVADVAAGEDEFGVWVAGWMRPSATEQQRYELRAATLSGDWRWIGTGMELVAALAVNVPGFPIPRVELAASGGRQVSLVASGVVPPTAPEVPDVFDIEKFAEAVAVHMSALSDRQERMAALKRASGRDPRARMEALIAGRN
jgi:hypothetical protein